MQKYTMAEADSSRSSFLIKSGADQYNSNVLVGNWYNERLKVTGRAHGILPTVDVHECLEAQTCYKSAYGDPNNSSDDSAWIERQMEMYHNKQRNVKSDVSLADSRCVQQLALDAYNHPKRKTPRITVKPEAKKTESDDELEAYRAEAKQKLDQLKANPNESLCYDYMTTYKEQFRPPASKPTEPQNNKHFN